MVPDAGFKGGEETPQATIEARREQDDLGKSLWVYWVVKDSEGKEERRPLREVNWAFTQEMDEGWSVGVGGYVARPTKVDGESEGSGELLEAEFGEGVEVEILG